MLCTAYLHQKAIKSQQIGKLAHKCGMFFLFQPTLPHNLCTLPFSRTLTTRTPLDNKQHGFYPPVVATPSTRLPPLKACSTPPPPQSRNFLR